MIHPVLEKLSCCPREKVYKGPKIDKIDLKHERMLFSQFTTTEREREVLTNQLRKKSIWG